MGFEVRFLSVPRPRNSREVQNVEKRLLLPSGGQRAWLSRRVLVVDYPDAAWVQELRSRCWAPTGAKSFSFPFQTPKGRFLNMVTASVKQPSDGRMAAGRSPSPSSSTSSSPSTFPYEVKTVNLDLMMMGGLMAYMKKKNVVKDDYVLIIESRRVLRIRCTSLLVAHRVLRLNNRRIGHRFVKASAVGGWDRPGPASSPAAASAFGPGCSQAHAPVPFPISSPALFPVPGPGSRPAAASASSPGPNPALARVPFPGSSPNPSPVPGPGSSPAAASASGPGCSQAHAPVPFPISSPAPFPVPGPGSRPAAAPAAGPGCSQAHAPVPFPIFGPAPFPVPGPGSRPAAASASSPGPSPAHARVPFPGSSPNASPVPGLGSSPAAASAAGPGSSPAPSPVSGPGFSPAPASASAPFSSPAPAFTPATSVQAAAVDAWDWFSDNYTCSCALDAVLAGVNVAAQEDGAVMSRIPTTANDASTQAYLVALHASVQNAMGGDQSMEPLRRHLKSLGVGRQVGDKWTFNPPGTVGALLLATYSKQMDISGTVACTRSPPHRRDVYLTSPFVVPHHPSTTLHSRVQQCIDPKLYQSSCRKAVNVGTPGLERDPGGDGMVRRERCGHPVNVISAKWAAGRTPFIVLLEMDKTLLNAAQLAAQLPLSIKDFNGEPFRLVNLVLHNKKRGPASHFTSVCWMRNGGVIFYDGMTKPRVVPCNLSHLSNYQPTVAVFLHDR